VGCRESNLFGGKRGKLLSSLFLAVCGELDPFENIFCNRKGKLGQFGKPLGPKIIQM